MRLEKRVLIFILWRSIHSKAFLVNFIQEEKRSWRSDIVERRSYRTAVKGEPGRLFLTVFIQIVSPLRRRVGFGLKRIFS